MGRFSTWDRHMFLVLGLLGVLGGILLPHYGESWDEHNMFDNASASWNLLLRTFGLSSETAPQEHPVLRLYGSWPWMLALAAFHVVRRLGVDLPAYFFSHALSWTLFLMGVLALYFLGKRWFQEKTAFWAALLMATQPLLWGHAFINLKDTGALAMTLLSLWAGLAWYDALARHEILPASCDLPGSARRRLGYMAVLLGAAVLGLWLRLKTPNVVWELEGRTFALGVVAKAGRVFGMGVGLAFLLGALWVWTLPKTARQRCMDLPARIFRDPRFWLATGTLGLSATLRVSGWWFGLFVGLLLVHRYRGLGLFVGILYGGLAYLIHILAWPAAWRSPLFFPMAVATVMSQFPWPGRVLFAGRLYPAASLPWWYAPWLHVIQLTEPALVLLAAGVLALPWLLRAKPRLGLLIGYWYGLPLLFIIWRRPVLYDNARQMLFLLPALFLLAGYPLDLLVRRRPWGFGVVVLVSLFANVGYLWSHHPYTYVYYNGLVGWVPGAYGRYEMDYWATSFREVAGFLDRQVPEGSKVVVWGPFVVLDNALTREFDLYRSEQADQVAPPFYAVILGRANWLQEVHPQAREVFQVRHLGVLLSVVRFVEAPSP